MMIFDALLKNPTKWNRKSDSVGIMVCSQYWVVYV